MCGIAGVVGVTDLERSVSVVRQMVDAQARRGPDGEGMESWNGAVLGHRRLSIFDLSDAGRQPMLSDDRHVGVVFNGAIYNFRSLREDLERSGYRFRSRTDTEVLVHGYREWGIDDLVARLRGMFAIGIWDDTKKKLFLIRDRLGVKPLVYSVKGGAIAFASTVRALAQAGFGDRIDDLALAEFVEYGFVTEARSIYREIRKLGAAEILEWSNGEIRIRAYWHLSTRPSRFSIGFDEAVEETERLFLQAVKRRLDADVPVGALLSGGVDSSLVCWAIAHLGADITAYTVGTPGSPKDETADASATASLLGIRHVILPTVADDGEMVENLVEAYGEPFASGSAIGMLRVSHAIRKSATVVLTGDGGDDVFLGYPWHLVYLKAQRAARFVPGWLPGVWRVLRRVIPEAGSLRRAQHLVDYVMGGLASVIHANPGLPACRRMGLLGERMLPLSVTERATPESLHSARELLSEILTFAQSHHFGAEFMTKVDGGTMFHALEARSPFLDRDLWEFAASLPYEIRLHQGRLKAVLRELSRRRIGGRVAAGRKRGFEIPVEQWLVGRWYRQAEETFQGSLLGRSGYICDRALLRCLAEAKRIGRTPLVLWYFFVLERWLRRQRSAGLSAAL